MKRTKADDNDQSKAEGRESVRRRIRKFARFSSGTGGNVQMIMVVGLLSSASERLGPHLD